ncbi:UNVERIFIED_CONTAM: hypothetical protein PYX00_009688 [Menopon gallinae]|uniref:Peptidase S1 domain-containing protein n=1 Tax=Menopon gallinae TaxID=328185 RepID=A0AAW2HCL0_9NEOP
MSASSLAVRTGSSRRQSGGAVHKVSRILMHPRYNSNTNDYDVGLLYLASNIQLGGNSRAISIIGSEPTSGRLLLSGWGDLREGANAGSPNLMSVEVNIVSRSSCEKAYASAVKITPRMFCGGAPGKDSCQGDSGGPAVVGGKLAGVVSFGIGCARPNYPGVYANLANSDIRQWIKQNAKV